jgi:hypothetical protein
MPRVTRPDKLSPRLNAARVLLFMAAFLWFCVGIYQALDMLLYNNGVAILLVVLFLHMNAVGMLVAGLWLRKRTRGAYWFSIFLLASNILLTRLGQYGLMDTIILILDLVALFLLIGLGRDYLKKT